MTSVTTINLGHLPGDAPIMTRNGWRRAFSREDVSIDHVRLHAKTFGDRSNWREVCRGRTYLAENTDANGYITVGKLRQSDWPEVRQFAIALGREQLQQTREAVIETRIGYEASAAEAAFKKLEASATNPFATHQLHSTWDTASASANNAVQAQLSLAMTLKSKDFPQALVEGAMTAYQASYGRFSAFQRGVQASIEQMPAQADQRAQLIANVSQAERDALTASLEKAKTGGFKFSKTKDFANASEPAHVITDFLRYGEIWVGESPVDPARQALTSYKAIAEWAAKWVGK